MYVMNENQIKEKKDEYVLGLSARLLAAQQIECLTSKNDSVTSAHNLGGKRR